MQAPSSPTDGDDKEPEGDLAAINLDKLDKILSGKAGGWKQTLEPPPGSRSSASGIWYRQVDASLMQLQQVAEDMSESLDDQLKLAQRLTIYLNYGIEQATNANNLLTANKDLF